MGDIKFEGTEQEWKELVEKNEKENANFLQVLDENGQAPKQVDSVLTTSGPDEIPVAKDMQEIVEKKDVDIKEFMANKENQDKAFDLAMQCFEFFGGKAFTLDRAVLKTKTEPAAMFQKLKLLEMFGYCVITKGDQMDPGQRGKTYFRLTVTMEHKIETLKEVIRLKKEEIATLENTLKIWIANYNKPMEQPVIEEKIAEPVIEQ